jgi:hypothetical protein
MNGNRGGVGRAWGLGCALGLALLGGACDGGDGLEACPGGEATAIAAGPVCVYRGGISETGFLCPPELPFAYEAAGYSACAGEAGLSEAVGELLASMPVVETEPGAGGGLIGGGCVGSECLGEVVEPAGGGAAEPTGSAAGAATEATVVEAATPVGAAKVDDDEHDEDHDDDDGDDDDDSDDKPPGNGAWNSGLNGVGTPPWAKRQSKDSEPDDDDCDDSLEEGHDASKWGGWQD